MREFNPLFGATVSDVNVNVEGTTREQINAQDIAKSKGNAFDVAGLMGQTAKVLEAERMKEANTAKDDWVNFYTSEEYRQAPSSIRVEMIENKIGGMTDKSEAYINGFKGYSAGAYSTEYERRNKEEDASMLNGVPAYVKDYMDRVDPTTVDSPDGPKSNAQMGKTIESAVEDIVKLNPRLDRNAIKNSLLLDLYGGFEADVDAVQTPEELVNVIADIKEEKKPYNTDKFLLTKGKMGAEKVAAFERALNSKIKAKQAEFVRQANDRYGSAKYDRNYSDLPQDVDKDIETIWADNPRLIKKEKADYRKNFQINNEARDYNMNNPIGQSTGIFPNDKTKELRQPMVTETLQTSFWESPLEFARIADNEKGLTKEVGTQMLTYFDSIQDKDGMRKFYTQLSMIDNTPKGPRALTQMLSDDEYARIMTVGAAMKLYPDKSLVEIRDWVNRGAGAISVVKLSPNVSADIEKFAIDLGEQSHRFKAVVNTIQKINPQLLEDGKIYKDIYENFKKSITEDSQGIKGYENMGENPSNGDNVWDKEDVDTNINSLGPDEISSKTYFPNNVVFFRDPYGMVSVVNATETINQSNQRMERQAIAEQQEEPNVFVKFGRVLVDNLPTMVIEPVKGLGGALKENITRNLRNDMANMGFTDAALDTMFGTEDSPNPNALDDFESSLEYMKRVLDVNEDDINGVQNNTMNPYTGQTLKEALKYNQAKIKQIDEVISKVREAKTVDEPIIPTADKPQNIEPTTMKEETPMGGASKKATVKAQDYPGIDMESVQKHMELREGNVANTYLDSRGLPTGGIGHLLTKEERKKYPVGTPIPKSVRDAWFTNDIAKATKAAKAQAEDIGIPELAEALVSVNFQLGTNWGKKFFTTYPALKKKQFDKVIGNLKGSAWMKQTPVRVNDFIDALVKVKKKYN